MKQEGSEKSKHSKCQGLDYQNSPSPAELSTYGC